MARCEPNYEAIFTYLSENKYPANFSKDEKRNLRRTATRSYVVMENRLFYKYPLKKPADTASPGSSCAGEECQREEEAYKLLRVVTSTADQQKFLKAAHEGHGKSIQAKALASHWGRDKTLRNLIDAGVYWFNMNKDLRAYLRTCANCQKADTKFPKAKGILHSVPIPTQVWSQVGIDLCKLVPSKEGYTGIIVVADYFSKWLEAKPFTRPNAEEVAMFLFELMCRQVSFFFLHEEQGWCILYPGVYFRRHGCVNVQINDQGREFCNEVAERLHSLCGVKQGVTSAYHPQANGLVERANRTIQGAFMRTLQEQIVFAYRTSTHRSTGKTPFEVFLRQESKDATANVHG